MTDGDDEIAVVWGIEDSVGVGPIGEHEGAAINIEVVELVPDPDGFVILVEIDDDIASDGAGDAGDGFLQAGEDEEMSVGEEDEIVVSAGDGNVAAGAGGGGESGVELRDGHLPDEGAAEVNFLDDGV